MKTFFNRKITPQSIAIVLCALGMIAPTHAIITNIDLAIKGDTTVIFMDDTHAKTVADGSEQAKTLDKVISAQQETIISIISRAQPSLVLVEDIVGPLPDGCNNKRTQNVNLCHEHVINSYVRPSAKEKLLHNLTEILQSNLPPTSMVRQIDVRSCLEIMPTTQLCHALAQYLRNSNQELLNSEDCHAENTVNNFKTIQAIVASENQEVVTKMWSQWCTCFDELTERCRTRIRKLSHKKNKRTLLKQLDTIKNDVTTSYQRIASHHTSSEPSYASLAEACCKLEEALITLVDLEITQQIVATKQTQKTAASTIFVIAGSSHTSTVSNFLCTHAGFKPASKMQKKRLKNETVALLKQATPAIEHNLVTNN